MVSVCCPQHAQRAVIRLLEPDGEMPALAQTKENTDVETVLVCKAWLHQESVQGDSRQRIIAQWLLQCYCTAI
jgi:hypothetical protein